MEKLSMVIFDMDGLMFDTERLDIWAWQKAGKDFGYDINHSISSNVIGSDFRDTKSFFMQYFGSSFPYDEIYQRKQEYMEQYLKNNGIPVKEGLYELIEFLENKSIMKAVATSTVRKKAEKRLSMGGIKDKFDAIVCGDDVEKGKPEPDIFLKAAKLLSCKPDHCIVLEDSDRGLIAASRAGMRPICIPDIKQPSKEVEKTYF
ncbi:HAD family phosphatase [Tepidanaerobacter sp. GT38]|uniref:HAD family hydrolase n=1 Tax=Tepidanaerobacter sp. GT38 TaxID=2722793 RepID=UPI001F25736F|nr:HAD family phosphatase [Tepidanaerobacter sp. GT38]MCG1013263.1 HAD family phosphatase [Tepidanaerobacter sp. GT38]